MKKVLLLVIVLLLLAAVVGLRLYQNRGEKPAEPEQTETSVADTAVEETPAPTPEPTPYDPIAALDLENADLDEETKQEIIQTEQEWASESTGTSQLSPADTSGGNVQSSDNVTIDIGEGQSGIIGF